MSLAIILTFWKVRILLMQIEVVNTYDNYLSEHENVITWSVFKHADMFSHNKTLIRCEKWEIKGSLQSAI